jgi:carbon-monoxide dehydrogenase iron sulfur subunit
MAGTSHSKHGDRRMHLEVSSQSCIGCNSCALTCSFVHDGEFGFGGTRIRVHKDAERAACQPHVCVQCESAPCVPACPSGALSRVARGSIVVDATKCVGCRACIPACPHHGVFFDAKRQLPLICDLCEGEPQCVEFCKFPNAVRVVAM